MNWNHGPYSLNRFGWMFFPLSLCNKKVVCTFHAKLVNTNNYISGKWVSYSFNYNEMRPFPRLCLYSNQNNIKIIVRLLLLWAICAQFSTSWTLKFNAE